MAVSKNFLPKFEVSEDLAKALRNIEIAKALSAGWYKGQFDYYLRKLGYITMINGEEYYKSAYGDIRGLQHDFFNKGTKGYYLAEYFRLLGMEDEDLKELQRTSTANKVDGVYHSWKAKEGLSNKQFKRHLLNMRNELINVDAIEVDYENQRYKTSAYPLEASRIYNSKDSLYGDTLQYGEIQGGYGDDGWSTDNRIFNLDTIQTKTVLYGFGKAIRFYKLGVDVTNNYSDELKYAVQSMLMYSGNEFMQRTSSVKIGELTYNVQKYSINNNGETDHYTSVIGKETFDATIKQTFLDDENDRHFLRYTSYCISEGGKGGRHYCGIREDMLDGRSPLESTSIQFGTKIVVYYTNAFWKYTRYIHSSNSSVLLLQPIVNAGDEFLFYSTGDRNLGAYIKASEFKKLSMDDIGYYIGEYFDIRVTVDKGGWFSGFVGFIAGMLGRLFDFAFDIINTIPVLKIQLQILTVIVNKTFGSNLTEKEVFGLGLQAVLIVLGLLFTPVTGGISLAIAQTALALGIAGSEAEADKKEAEEQSEKEKKEKEDRQKEREKEQEQERLKQTLNGQQQLDEKEEFEMFLKNPLYKIDMEKKQMKSDFKSQFKLI